MTETKSAVMETHGRQMTTVVNLLNTAAKEITLPLTQSIVLATKTFTVAREISILITRTVNAIQKRIAVLIRLTNRIKNTVSANL